MHYLHVDSITKNYGDRVILSDAWLSCRTGEIVGILGRNGSGKSTLLRIISGSLKADNSFISVDGGRLSRLAEISDRIKYLPQDRLLSRGMKLRRAVDLLCPDPYRNAKIKEDPVRRPFLGKRGGTMSEGERRMAEVLMLLYSDADFVMLDEPFQEISPLHRDKIKEYIKDFVTSGNKGVIITDHDYHNVFDIADRIFTVKRGVVKESGEEVFI